ncbi:MAG TPA: ROK family transcriptional regulator [Tepidisphaeraceae bacterium]|jgi:predicted NBD/HSP70 family sugar kinase
MPAQIIRQHDQLRKRAANRYAILRALHFEGALQRAELSRRLGIRKTSVTNITAELIEMGWVNEDAPDSFRSPLSLNEKGPYALVARLGIGQIETARVRLDGQVESIQRVSFAPNALSEHILQLIEKSLSAQIGRGRKHILGIGFADMGIVDPRAGVTRVAVNLQHWQNIPVRQRLEKTLGLGVRVDNDVRSQLWASAWFDRQLRECKNMLYVGLLDEGLGGALIMNGQIVVGRTFGAGEFGHVRAGREGRVCSCGKLDCLETYCSISAIEQEIAQNVPGRKIQGAEAIAKTALDDAKILKILDSVVARLAEVVSHSLATLDPDALVLGTPSPMLSSIFAELLHKHLQLEMGSLATRDVRLILTGADNRATLAGIGGMVIDQCFRDGEKEMRCGGSDIS